MRSTKGITLNNPELAKYTPGWRAHRHIYIAGAYQRGLTFDLTVESLAYLFASPCFYCGEPPQRRVFCASNKNPYVEHLSGIDRLLVSRGYEADNVVACCKRCNKLKAGFDAIDFINAALAVAAHYKK